MLSLLSKAIFLAALSLVVSLVNYTFIGIAIGIGFVVIKAIVGA